MMILPLKTFGFSDALGSSGLGFLIVLAVLAVLMVFVKLLSRIIRGTTKNSDSEPVTQGSPVTEPNIAQPVAETPKPSDESTTVPHIPGYVVLDGVSEQDAAVIMAITSFKTGIPLERLSFNCIKRLNQDPLLENVSEQDAAVIMAITSNKTGIPLENLCFNSIKLVEE